MSPGPGELVQLVQLVQELVKVTAYLFVGTSIIVVLTFLHHRSVSKTIERRERVKRETMKKGT